MIKVVNFTCPYCDKEWTTEEVIFPDDEGTLTFDIVEKCGCK